MGCSERTDTTLNGTELNWSVVLATLKRSFYFRSMLLYVHRVHTELCLSLSTRLAMKQE